MYRTVFIGLGTIAAHHARGVLSSPLFDVCAICDIKEDAPSRANFSSLPFYTDYHEMFDKEQPDIAIIATTPDSHCQIIMDCIQRHVYALVEKPLSYSTEEVRLLLPHLKDSFDIIYHWMFAQEVLWFKRCIRIKDLKKISIQINDPYCDADGHILSEKQRLGGCWVDSGVNALSMLSLWVDLETLKDMLVQHTIDDGCNLPVATRVRAKADGVEVDISIDWRQGINHKTTTIDCERHTYSIEHSSQSVYEVVKGESQLLFSDETMPRLDRHYYNFYSLYPSSLITRQTTERILQIIHI